MKLCINIYIYNPIMKLCINIYIYIPIMKLCINIYIYNEGLITRKIIGSNSINKVRTILSLNFSELELANHFQ